MNLAYGHRGVDVLIGAFVDFGLEHGGNSRMNERKHGSLEECSVAVVIIVADYFAVCAVDEMDWPMFVVYQLVDHIPSEFLVARVQKSSLGQCNNLKKLIN